jgi:type IV secretion system protein VirB1
MDLATCAPLVDPILMSHVVRVESGGNPFAIGVVGGRLVRQPRTLPEAVATVKALEASGYNYSIGIGQINRVHFTRLGWRETIQLGFDVCTNLQASAGVLYDCYARAVGAGYPAKPDGKSYSATHAALSCYYSGSFVKGAQLGYVSRVLGSSPGTGSAPVPARRKNPTSMLVE